MSRPRKKIFGPLLYSTLIVAAVAVVYTGLMRVLPKLDESRLVRSLVAELRGDNPRGRESAAIALLRRGSDVAVPYLIEAARDPRGEVRAMACRCLVNMGPEPSTVVPCWSSRRAMKTKTSDLRSRSDWVA
jgi:hypothetical protein